MNERAKAESGCPLDDIAVHLNGQFAAVCCIDFTLALTVAAVGLLLEI